MAREIALDAGSLNRPLHHSCDVAAVHSGLLEPLETVVPSPRQREGRKHRTFADSRDSEPFSDGRNRAALRVAQDVGHSNSPAPTFLVGVRFSHRHDDASIAEREVRDVERRELRPSERTGEPEQQDGAIALSS